MFFNNKYINRSLAVKTNNVQTTNCSSVNIQTSNIQNLKRLGINKNNPNYTLDVGGNINFTGNLLQNGKPYGIGFGYWNLVGDNITNSNIGSVNINTSLDVQDNTTLSTLSVIGSETIGGTLDVEGDTTLSTLTVISNETIEGTLDVQGETTLFTLSVTNNETIGGTLDVAGDTTLSTLSVIGNETIEGTLDVQFNTTLSTLTVISNETIEGTLDVSGNTTMSTLSVSGNETIEGTLNVSGNTTMSTLSVSGNETIGGTLNISGNTNISNLLTVNSITLTATSPVYNSNSVVPKSYVDTLSSGIILIGPCACATTSSSDTTDWVYDGSSVFNNVETPLVLDGYVVENGQRVLVKDFMVPDQVQNGAYVYAQTSGTLTRVSDLAYGESANSVITFVQYGNTNKKTSFLQTTNPAIVGTSNLIFVSYYSNDFTINNTLVFNNSVLGVNPTLSLTSLNISATTDDPPTGGTLDVSNNTTIGGTLLVTGNTTLSTVSTTGLTVSTGGASITGSVIISNGLTISAGGASITGTLSTTGLTVTGNASFTGTSTVNSINGFSTGSDYRIKDNIVPLDSTYTVDKLTPIKFTNKNTGNQDIGLIAHELQEFYPELVTGHFDGEQLQTVNYQGLIGILIQEIKSLKQEIKEIKEKVNM
jgi:hypothetical protein